MNEDEKVETSDFTDALIAEDLSRPERSRVIDHKRFNQIQSNIDTRMKAYERDKRRADRASNLRLWDRNTPRRWRGATLSSLDERVRERCMEFLKDLKSGNALFLYGPPGSGKTHTAYAVIRKMVAKGFISPGRFMRITESSIESMANNGYKGANEFSDLLNRNYDAVIIDNLNAERFYSDKVEAMMEELLTKLYEDSTVLILCSQKSADQWYTYAPSGSVSSMRSSIGNRVIELPSGTDNDLDSGADDRSSEHGPAIDTNRKPGEVNELRFDGFGYR